MNVLCHDYEMQLYGNTNKRLRKITYVLLKMTMYIEAINNNYNI